MPTALIADDEDLPRAQLRDLLASAWPQLDVVCECEDGDSALAALAAHAPAVVFLDIRMPGPSGLDVARVASAQSQVVFLTAYDAHAVAAFDAGAVDYLLKPVDADRLAVALKRVRARLAGREASSTARAAVTDVLDRLAAPTSALQWITASVGDVVRLIPVDKVVYFESSDRYTRVVTEDAEAWIRLPLKQLLAGLDPERFWQIGRGAIVRAEAIDSVRRDDLGCLRVSLRGRSETLRVQRPYVARFRPM